MLFAIRFSFAQNLTAVQRFPDSVTIGSSFIVTTTIYGGPLIDFMEFSQPLPNGFSARSIESKGGNFMFTKNNEVKIIWLTPPMQDSFTIKYLIQVPSSVSGKQTRSGKIMYVTTSNERKVFILQTKKILLINPKYGFSTFYASNPTKTAVHTTESDDFLGENGKAISEGFYVVIATFNKRENADKCRAASVMRGHMNTKIIQNQFTKAFTVFALKTNNKADADAERLKYKSEYPDVWILKLQNVTGIASTESTSISPVFAQQAKTSTTISDRKPVVRTNKSDYFLDENNQPVSNGFYIIVGTFGSKENAYKLRTENIAKGHKKAAVIQNQITKVYNTYVLKTNERADADAEIVKYKEEYPDAWILKLE